MLRAAIATDALPDYHLAEDPGDLLRVTPRRAAPPLGLNGPALREDTHDRARALAPGRDVHALEAEWRAFWDRSGRPRLRAPDAAFLGFVARVVAAD
jgi:hypothetical protein